MEYGIFRALDKDGDGTGDTNANEDYSVTPDIFFIQPPAGAVYYINRLIVSIEDTGGMQAQEYGNLGAALTNGIVVRASDDSGVVVEYTAGLPVRTNAGWAQHCYDADVKTWGAGNDILAVRWTFGNSARIPRFRGDRNERLEVYLNDDFTGLIGHYFIAQGYHH